MPGSMHNILTADQSCQFILLIPKIIVIEDGSKAVHFAVSTCDAIFKFDANPWLRNKCSNKEYKIDLTKLAFDVFVN